MAGRDAASSFSTCVEGPPLTIQAQEAAYTKFAKPFFFFNIYFCCVRKDKGHLKKHILVHNYLMPNSRFLVFFY